ncbi:MAG: Lrp/AsnC ligand binding domain-containing protein, partial [Promethearchaeota archaeon]
YFIFYVLAVNWPKHTSFDLWVGVLQLSEPIINIILGITVLEEDFPLSWLMIIIFLMLIAVLTRYLSETETTIFAIFLLKVNFQAKLPVMKKVFTFKAVKQIQSLTGEHDLLLDTQFHSAKHFNRFIQKQLIPLAGLEKYELLMITGQELDRNI